MPFRSLLIGSALAAALAAAHQKTDGETVPLALTGPAAPRKSWWRVRCWIDLLAVLRPRSWFANSSTVKRSNQAI